jgi:hypothetical protein
MSSKNLMNQPIKLLTDRELHEIRKCGDLSLDEIIVINDELDARYLARHEKLTKINTYEFRWWHFILAVMAIRAIVKIAQSS